jgi:hypothetical protein
MMNDDDDVVRRRTTLVNNNNSTNLERYIVCSIYEATQNTTRENNITPKVDVILVRKTDSTVDNQHSPVI